MLPDNMKVYLRVSEDGALENSSNRGTILQKIFPA